MSLYRRFVRWLARDELRRLEADAEFWKGKSIEAHLDGQCQGFARGEASGRQQVFDFFENLARDRVGIPDVTPADIERARKGLVHLMDWQAMVGKTVTDGRGFHHVVGYWSGPVIVLRDVRTGAEKTLGVDGLTARGFYPAINGPGEYDHTLGGYPERRVAMGGEAPHVPGKRVMWG